MITLNEVRRSQSLAKSKQSDAYVNQSKGRNRFERRLHSKIRKSVNELNKIDMNKLFKDEILDISLQVAGETDDYTVRISFGTFLNHLRSFVKNEEDLNLRAINRALVSCFNTDDVYFRCSCADFKYRQAYFATQNGTIIGDPETRPSNITNPNDTKGAGCKHINLVLSNNSWLLKVSAVIFNYINYMKKHYEQMYAEIIYPAIYDKEYEEPVQTDMFADGNLADDQDVIDASNKWARTKNQFEKGWDKKFTDQSDQSSDEDSKIPNWIFGQQKFDLDSLADNT